MFCESDRSFRKHFLVAGLGNINGPKWKPVVKSSRNSSSTWAFRGSQKSLVVENLVELTFWRVSDMAFVIEHWRKIESQQHLGYAYSFIIIGQSSGDVFSLKEHLHIKTVLLVFLTHKHLLKWSVLYKLHEIFVIIMQQSN